MNTPLDRLRLVRFSITAESAAGEMRVERESDDSDGMTFFVPRTIYHREVVVDANNTNALKELLFETPEGVDSNLVTAFMQCLDSIDKERSVPR